MSKLYNAQENFAINFNKFVLNYLTMTFYIDIYSIVRIARITGNLSTRLP